MAEGYIIECKHEAGEWERYRPHGSGAYFTLEHPTDIVKRAMDGVAEGYAFRIVKVEESKRIIEVFRKSNKYVEAVENLLKRVRAETWASEEGKQGAISALVMALSSMESA